MNLKNLALGLLSLSLLYSTPSTANETVLTLSAGQGFTNNLDSGFFNAGVETYFQKHYTHKLEAGFWSDNQKGHSGAFYGSLLLGRRLGDYTGLNATFMVGVVVMTAPDALLSTPFQFTEEVNVGYKQWQFGIKHFSNAGIELPNVGRDYLYLRYLVPLN